jgi:peroxiredoxin
MIRPLAALTAISLLLGAACGSTGAASGDVAAFARPSVQGERFDLARHLGKDVVLISFWTTYCEPCKVEMPFLQQYHDKYGSQGFAVVSVSMDGPDTVAEVRPYIRRMGFTYPVVIDEDGSIAQRMNPVAAAPFAILVGRDGKVRQRFSGFKAGEAPILEAAIVAALAEGELAPPEPEPAPAEPAEPTPAPAEPAEPTPAPAEPAPEPAAAP